MDTPIIELRKAAFAAQNTQIVYPISYAFEEKKATALVGPSGCGKSTVLKLAAGLIVPTEGEAYFRGNPISTMNRARNLAFRKESAFVFQDSALWANQTLRQILELPLRIHYPKITHAEIADAIKSALAECGYHKSLDVRPSQLSMGEQKLIAFARATLCAPALFFLDEWTESLDDSAARRLVSVVKRRKESGATIIFVSHSFRVIKEVADTICMFNDGRLAFTVTAEEFAANDSLAKVIEKGIAT